MARYDQNALYLALSFSSYTRKDAAGLYFDGGIWCYITSLSMFIRWGEKLFFYTMLKCFKLHVQRTHQSK